MAEPVDVNDLVDGHVALEVECLDRIYLNGYVPNLQVGGQVVTFLCEHRQNPVPSPALFNRIGARFRQAVDRFVLDNEIPVIRFAKDDRKADVMRRYLRAAERAERPGVVAIGVAQEFQSVFAASDRNKGKGHPSFDTPFNPITCLAEPDPNPRSVCEESGGLVSKTTVNPQFSSSGPFSVNVDGIEGWDTAPFTAAPDALLDDRPFPDEDQSGLGSFGGGTIGADPLQFAIAWTSAPDAAGGILTRAQGMNAELLRDRFSERFDNTDIYRMMYKTLFREMLPTGVGVPAQDR